MGNEAGTLHELVNREDDRRISLGRRTSDVRGPIPHSDHNVISLENCNKADLIALLDREKETHNLEKKELTLQVEKLMEKINEREREQEEHSRSMETRQQKNNNILTGTFVILLLSVAGCTLAMLAKACINTSDAPEFKV